MRFKVKLVNYPTQITEWPFTVNIVPDPVNGRQVLTTCPNYLQNAYFTHINYNVGYADYDEGTGDYLICGETDEVGTPFTPVATERSAFIGSWNSLN